MERTSKIFLTIGGIAELLTGIGHLLAEAFVLAPDSKRLKSYLNSYDFNIMDSPVSLYQFHMGYSITMAVLSLFIGTLCLTLRNPSKSTLMVLCIGEIVLCGLMLKFFGSVPLYLSVIAVIAFMLAYWTAIKKIKRMILS